MKTKFITAIIFFINLLFVFSANAQEGFVRKKLKPEFFIPEKEFNKPAKPVPVPQYTKGQVETIKVAQPEPEEAVPQTVQPKITKPGLGVVVPDQVSQPVRTVPDADYKQEPEYQQKYQEYMKDLGEVSRGRKLPENNKLKDDLSQMNSEDRILIDKKFNETRNPQKDFEKALKTPTK